MTLTTDDNLDELALKKLVLLDELLKSREILSEFMKNGFYQLSSARKSLGQHAVSALRIPESVITASFKTVEDERLDDTFPSVSFKATEIVKVDLKDKEDEGLEEEVKCASKKPINWFSALPPPSLRQAQSNFDAALRLAATCVTLQNQLTAVDKSFETLKKELKKN